MRRNTSKVETGVKCDERKQTQGKGEKSCPDPRENMEGLPENGDGE